MARDETHIIKPPIGDAFDGRVFQPTNSFLFKKIVKVSLVLLLLWIGLFSLFLGFANPIIREILLALFGPLELLAMVGWESVNQVFIICAIAFVALGSIYTYVYIRRIEYSVMGWSGNVMPEIFTQKGIMNITKKHVPFRTIVNVRTTKGVFDRLFGIGNVLVETAGGSIGTPPTSVIALLISKLSSSAYEEKIEGIRFDEELRDFILREMRSFSKKPSERDARRRKKRRKRIFTREILDAFIEVRDALKESMEA